MHLYYLPTLVNKDDPEISLSPLKTDMATLIQLAPEIEQRLDDLAAKTGHTKAFHINEIIECGLEDIEDYYLAAAVLERVRKGEEPVYSLDEVMRHHGLADLIAGVTNENKHPETDWGQHHPGDENKK